MTIKDLSQLYWLTREIEKDSGRLEELYEKATGTASAIGGVTKAPGFTDKVGRYAVEIAELRSVLEARRDRCEAEKVNLERYIDAIPDSLTRQIFHFRFVDGQSWELVAQSVGGGNTKNGVKKRVFRYLEKSSPNVTP